ncbi:hypothetical protein GGR51DRAFT_242287 [Nemania sp. FL0031]|nr:hypothetical protein GGR51DRAFT_242287 [Nemania sp. FL0031]
MANVFADSPCAKPPLSPPACNYAPPRICVRHPGYREFGESASILLQLPAVDTIIEPSSQARIWGLHHATALTACGIIADNAFDLIYLSYDVYGYQPVQIPRYGLLKPGDYWLQKRKQLPPVVHRETGSITNTPTTRPSLPLPSPAPTSTSTPTPRGDNDYEFPIVPSFRDWKFPHGKLPAEWVQLYNPTNQPPLIYQTNRCLLTDCELIVEQCHIIPRAKQDWFQQNDMQRYCPITSGPKIDDPSNTIPFMVHIHRALDNNLFVIIPKPSASSPSLDPPVSSTTAAEPRPHTFAVHVISGAPEACEFAYLYHNRSIQPKFIAKLQPEFLFARFAHALFPYLRYFLFELTCPRHLTVIEKNEPIEKWMSSLQYTEYQIDREQSFCGYKRRRSAPSDQDEELNDEDDICEERWRQRSASRERWLSEYGRDLDTQQHTREFTFSETE